MLGLILGGRRETAHHTSTPPQVEDGKAQRKAAKKEMKALRRAKRAGTGPAETGQKSCDVCGASVNLLVRCRARGRA